MYGTVILTASILTNYVTWQGTNLKLLDDDIEMSKYVGIYIIYRDILIIYNCALVGCNKTIKDARYTHYNKNIVSCIVERDFFNRTHQEITRIYRTRFCALSATPATGSYRIMSMRNICK